MMQNKAIQQQLCQFAHEHEELTSIIDEVQQWIHEVSELGIPHFGELATRLRPLLEQLCEHMEHEEQNGYLAGATKVLPELRSEAESLLAQHDDFRSELRELIDRLRESELPYQSWQEACVEFQSILDRLGQHEKREMEILNAGCRESEPEVQ